MKISNQYILAQLNENTLSIIELLKSRQHLLSQLLRIENISDSTDINKDVSRWI
jgi:hypothetical protein